MLGIKDFIMKGIFKRAWIALLFMPVFFISCSSYRNSMTAYYDQLQAGNYDKALKKIEGSKFFKRTRNRLLFCMEAGKVSRLKNDYVASNVFFNEADDIMETFRKSAKDIALGNIINPMMEAYKGEDFELFMIHYYKALNYLDLGMPDEAVVESRRISLATDRLSDKTKSNKYSKDAFALNLQGMLYEAAGDYNNAFIAYRNAADIYLAEGNGSYYGVQIPLQLKQDLLRMARVMGFTDEQSRYEKLLGISTPVADNANGELIVFIEEGRAPVKQEQNFFLTNAGIGGGFMYLDGTGRNTNLPFDHHSYGISDSKLSAVRTLRVALPVYQQVSSRASSITVSLNGQSYSAQLAEDLNNIAVSVLRERFVKEMANAVARQLTKKVLEKGAEKTAEGIARRNEKKSDKQDVSEEEKEKKRKQNEEKAKAAGEVAGFIVNMANTLSERADTRNWQSLPAYISYVRIPLKEGENKIDINLNGKIKTHTIQGGKGLRFVSEINQ